MVDENRVPHFLFYGPPGTGKTSTILAMARRLYNTESYRSRVLELNASDDRGIDVVRTKIVQFSESAAMGFASNANPDAFKLIVLDEADAMTKDAQNALKRIIEKYSRNVRFCLICNHLSSIIPAIQSRCTRFRFPPLSKDQVMPRLNYVIENEGLSATEDGKEALYDLSGGDMRKILNVLQSTSLAFDIVNRQNVYSCVGQPSPDLIRRIVEICLNEDIRLAIEKVGEILCVNALSLADVLENMCDLLLRMNLKPEGVLPELLKQLSKIQVRVVNGCSESLQLNAVVSSFILAREKTFASN